MKTLEAILSKTKEKAKDNDRFLRILLRAIFVVGSLYLNACKDPVSPLKPEPEPKSFQTAVLENFIDINYTARLENMEKAPRKILRDNVLIKADTIKGPLYQETLKNNLKGKYDFIVLSDTATVTVPDYAPDVSFLGLQTNMDEGGEINLNLESMLANADKNPEDNPVPLISAMSLDGKTQVSVNGKNLNIKSLTDKIGNYLIGVEIGSDAGERSTKNLNGIIYDLLDVEGVLEDNETHSRQLGIIKVYNSSNIKIGEIPIDNSGQFRKKFSQRVTNLTNGIFIQGRKIENGENKSYVRTLKLPGADQRGLTLRVVPYDGLAENGITSEDFRKHVAEVVAVDKITKWNFGEDPNANYSFKEIIILKQNPDSTAQGHFNQATAENIKSRILDPNDIGAWFNGKIINPNQVRIEENYNFQFPRDYGKIVVYPQININDTGLPDLTGDGYIDFGTIRIDVNSNGELINLYAITHEFGHVSGLPGHAETLSQEKTIMRSFLSNVSYSTPRFADRKTAKAMYEETYKHGRGRIGSKSLLGLDDILGLNFLDEK